MVACLSPNGPTIYTGATPPRHLYVGASGGVSVLERATPTAPWRLTRRGLDGKHVSAMMCDPAGAWVAAGSHDGGFYFSTDAGASWEQRTKGLTIEHAFSLTSADEAGKPVFYLGTLPVAAFRSRDLGRSWEELASLRAVPGQDKWTFPGLPHTPHAKCIAIDPRSPDTIYVAVEQGGLFRSKDGGATWREIDSYYRPDDRWYRDIHRLVMADANPDELYMTSGTGLYHSRDAGASWDHLTDTEFRIGYPDHLVISPRDAGVLFMSGGQQDPTAWRRSHYADATVLKSSDGGRSWDEARRGLPESRRANVEAMCMARHGNGFTLFLGNTDGEVFTSEDEGASWSLIASGVTPISKLGHFRLVEPA